MGAQIIRISKDKWWQTDREPAAKALVVPAKRKASSKLLTVKEVAERMNVGIWLVYDLIREGQLDCQPVGRRGKRVPADSLEFYLDRRRAEEQAKRR